MRVLLNAGVTLVEIVIVIVVIGILCVTTPPLVSHGVKALVYLPKALAVNHVAGEVLGQIVEGGHYRLTGLTDQLIVNGVTYFYGQAAPVRGTRIAVSRAGSSQPAVWLAEATRIGFRTADDNCVYIRLDAGRIKRCVTNAAPPPANSCDPAIPCDSTNGTEETVPYDVAEAITIIPVPPALFRYYNDPVSGRVRRVDIEFIAQTGNGDFDQGDALERITSSVAIRIP